MEALLVTEVSGLAPANSVTYSLLQYILPYSKHMGTVSQWQHQAGTLLLCQFRKGRNP